MEHLSAARLGARLVPGFGGKGGGILFQGIRPVHADALLYILQLKYFCIPDEHQMLCLWPQQLLLAFRLGKQIIGFSIQAIIIKELKVGES